MRIFVRLMSTPDTNKQTHANTITMKTINSSSTTQSASSEHSLISGTQSAHSVVLAGLCRNGHEKDSTLCTARAKAIGFWHSTPSQVQWVRVGGMYAGARQCMMEHWHIPFRARGPQSKKLVTLHEQVERSKIEPEPQTLSATSQALQLGPLHHVSGSHTHAQLSREDEIEPCTHTMDSLWHAHTSGV